jgi:hypothetical protein
MKISILTGLICLFFSLPFPAFSDSPDNNTPLVPTCAAPDSLKEVFVSSDSIRFYVFGKATEIHSGQFKKPKLIFTNTAAFGKLSENTTYDFYVRRICPTPQENIEEYSDWVHLIVKTKKKPSVDCQIDPTTFSISNILKNSFKVNPDPYRDLSQTGRRFIVRFKRHNPPTSGPMSFDTPWETRVLDNESDTRIIGLQSGANYKVYIQEVRGGSGTEYETECPEAGPFYIQLLTLQSQCNYATNASIACTGTNFVNIHFDNPALGSDSLRYMVAVWDTTTISWATNLKFQD